MAEQERGHGDDDLETVPLSVRLPRRVVADLDRVAVGQSRSRAGQIKHYIREGLARDRGAVRHDVH